MLRAARQHSARIDSSAAKAESPATTRAASHLNSIILTNWTNHDKRGIRTYSTSYTLRDEDDELYTLDLNKQMGFYQISEFVALNGSDHFIIEQTNRVGTPKIAAFDKDSGRMIGTFKGNRFVDGDENLIFTVENIAQVRSADTDYDCAEEDFAAIAADDQHVVALFCHLPRKPERGQLLTRLKQSINRFSSAPKDIYQIFIKDQHCCDPRMLCAIAVILHSRGGLQIDSKITPY